MAICDTQALLNSAAAFSDVTDEEAATLRLALLASIAGKTQADIQTLLTSGSAFADMTEEQQQTLKLQMLCEWSN